MLLLVIFSHGQGAGDEDATAQLSKLQALMFAYADKYMSGIAQVTQEAQERDPTNPGLRLRMHSLKLVVTASVQQLAVSSNPESTLLDMMVFATLHRMVFEEGWARKRYGDEVESIVSTMRILEEEIWDIAGGYLTEKQIAEVRKLIRDWRAKHPKLRVVSYIRFSDFASLRSKSPLVDRARSGGFLVDTSGAEKLMARFDSGPEDGDSASEPFDIDSYVNAIKELTVALREANTLLLSTERLTGGETATGGIFNRVLWTGTILILILCVAVFVTMLIYRAAARHIVARSSFEYVGPSPDSSK